jgi:hypothetical protein
MRCVDGADDLEYYGTKRSGPFAVKAFEMLK